MKSPQLLIYAMALAFAGIAQAGYTPIAIQSSSYNADVIVESNARPTLTISTTASVDNGTNNTANTWFEIGFDTANPGNGLPAAGSTFTAVDDATHSFTMPPSYTAPNGILIDTVVTTGTFTLVTPAKYTKLSFLGSGGNGGDQINVRVNHQDGTFETGTFGCPDWFGGSGVAYIAGGRCNSTVNLTTETDSNNPRIYFRDITLTNTTSPVTSIVLSYASGQASSHNDIMGVSGATPTSGTTVAPIAVTGYDYDFVVEAGAPKNGRVATQVVVDGTNVWATTQSIDNEGNTASSWYEQGYNINNADSGSYDSPAQDLTGTGLPHPGSLITNATQDHIYRMPPDYTVNNAVYIGTPASFTNATITLTTPTAFSGLSFLGSAGNGPVTVNLVINHQGGAPETQTLTVNDWFNGSAPVAYIANGRVAVDTAQYSAVNGNNPRLLQNDIVLSDTVNPVTSIYLENTNTTGGRFAIFAISGSGGALPPVFVQQPVSTNAYAATSAFFTASATANAPITYQWQKGTNGVFVNLANGGNISGVTTTTLNVSTIGFADQADYRLVATDVAGFTYSAAATLQVFSADPDITQPGDSITALNVSAFGDGAPANAIDNEMATKFGANISGGVAALIINPAAGRTVVRALRIYTGNDSTGRDPSSYKLEGSTDGGAHYTLISSNSISLPDGRNANLSGPPDPLTQFVTEVRFINTQGYTTYKLSFPTYKQAGGTQVQFQELELPGVLDNSQPFFNPQPVPQKAFAGNSVSFTAVAIYTPTPTVSWSKGTNGIYVPLTDSGNISGSQSTTLSINPATFADVADYIAIAHSTAGFVTSSIAHLYIYSTNVDVSHPGDTIIGFGDTTGGHYGANTNAAYVIDNAAYSEWQNGGSGLNASAGFPPFAGPVGVILTPAVGSTVLTGLRVYPGADPAANDPSGFVLEGSNNGGTSYSLIASGALSLPPERNSSANVIDPTQASVQEVLFSNTRGFTTYRLTFPSVADTNAVSFLEVDEVEFLGVPGVGVQHPVFSAPKLIGGNLSLSGSGGPANGTFTVRTNANVAVPVASWGAAKTGTFDASGNFSISLPVSAANPRLFYLIQTP
jgi:hypothetical protein